MGGVLWGCMMVLGVQNRFRLMWFGRVMIGYGDVGLYCYGDGFDGYGYGLGLMC